MFSLLTGFSICPLVPYFPTSLITNFETTTSTFEILKSIYNPTRCTCFATVSRNQNWPIINSFPQVKEKQK